MSSRKKQSSPKIELPATHTIAGPKYGGGKSTARNDFLEGFGDSKSGPRYVLEFPFTLMTWVLLFMQMSINLYLIIKYLHPDYSGMLPAGSPFIEQNIWLLFQPWLGILIHSVGYHAEAFRHPAPLIFRREKEVDPFLALQKQKKERRWLGYIVLGGFLGFILAVFFQFIILRAFIKEAILPIETVMFFLSMAISEEFLYRYGIQTVFEKIGRKAEFKRVTMAHAELPKQDPLRNYLSTIIALIAASLIFALYHLFVYGLVEILALVTTGIIFGLAFRITRSIDAAIIAHLLVNFIAGLDAAEILSLGLGTNFNPVTAITTSAIALLVASM